MRAASIVFATVSVLAIGGCHQVGDSDPMIDDMEGMEEGRIDFSRTTSFDGDKLTVFVRDGEDGKLHLNTMRDAVETNEFRPQIPNHSGRSWVLRNTAHESTTQVYALVSWNNEDPTDYLAAGWWLHQGEDDRYPERAIFFDGPEIDPVMNPPELPVTGTANYLGRGSGVFGYAFGIGLGRAPGRLHLRRVSGGDGRRRGLRGRHAQRVPRLHRRPRHRSHAPRSTGLSRSRSSTCRRWMLR